MPEESFLDKERRRTRERRHLRERTDPEPKRKTNLLELLRDGLLRSEAQWMSQ